MRYKLLTITILFLLFVVSGCIDKPQTLAEKAGWDQAKYDKYSRFYDNINNSFKACIHYKEGDIVHIEDFMVGMPQDTEFDKTWYLTFLYFKRGIEACRDEVEKVRAQNAAAQAKYATGEWDYKITYRAKGVQARKYLEQAYEYRQQIEDLRLDSSGNGKVKMKSNSSEGGITKLKLSPSEDGKVNIVEFLKFDCSHCYDLHKSLPSLLKKYEGKITITYIPIVWQQQSTKSIEAYIIAEQMGKGKEMMDALFQAKFQNGLDIMENTVAIEDVAASIGLGTDFKTKLEGGEAKKTALGYIGMISDYGIQGTPTLVINGNITVDPPTIANLEEVVGSMMNAISQSSSR